MSTLRHTSDESLMLDFQKGQHEAFTQLYQRYQNATYRYFLGMSQYDKDAGLLHRDLWESVVSEREHYRLDWTFSVFLFSNAHHLVMDYYHDHDRALLLQFSEHAPEDHAALNVPDDIALKQIYQALPLPILETYLLTVETKLPPEHIAEVCGVSRATACHRQREALRLLFPVLASRQPQTDPALSEASIHALYRASHAAEVPPQHLNLAILRFAELQKSLPLRIWAYLRTNWVIPMSALLVVLLALLINYNPSPQISKPKMEFVNTSTPTPVAQPPVATSLNNPVDSNLTPTEIPTTTPLAPARVKPRAKPEATASSSAAPANAGQTPDAQTTAPIPHTTQAEPTTEPTPNATPIPKPAQDVKPVQKTEEPAPQPHTPGPPRDNYNDL